MGSRTRHLALALVLGAAALFLAAPAGAQDPPPISAVSQYVEMVPAASGERAGSGDARSDLPAPAKKALAQVDEKTAAALEEVATSARYGAPLEKPEAKPAPEPKPEPAQTEPVTTQPEPAPTVPDAGEAPVPDVPALRSSGVDGDRRLVVLLVALGLVTAAIVASAVTGRRRGRP